MKWLILIIAIALLIISLWMMYNTCGLVDIGMILFIVAVFGLLIFILEPRQVEAASRYPIAGISKVMIEATTKPLTVETSEVVEVGISNEEAQKMEADIDLLARLITAEVGYSTAYDPLDYETACYITGSVILNRMKHEKFPNTLYGVIYQCEPTLQYQCTVNGHIERPYDDIAWEVAEELLTYDTKVPEDVIYQANFPQGSGIYAQIGKLYFCYE